MNKLRQLIRYMLIESYKEDDGKKHDKVDPNKEERDDGLLLEPDETEPEDEDVKEMNAMGVGGVGGAVRGVTTPLGAGPTYPDAPAVKKKKKKGKKQPRTRPVVVSKAFGGGNFTK